MHSCVFLLPLKIKKSPNRKGRGFYGEWVVHVVIEYCGYRYKQPSLIFLFPFKFTKKILTQSLKFAGNTPLIGKIITDI